MTLVELESHLSAPAEAVWSAVSSFRGVNCELRPLVRMTVPRGGEQLAPGPLGRSWLLLFGAVPIDFDDIVLIRLEPGRGFHERSTMLSMRRWEHERRIEPTGDASCRLEDRVSFEPRLGLPAAPLVPLVRRVFEHRHRRLRNRFC